MEKEKVEGSSGNGEDQPRQPSKPWHSYISKDLSRSFMESTDAAIRSARSLHHDSSSRLRVFQDLIPGIKLKYTKYEDALFNKFKDGLATGLQNPTMTAGITLAAVFLLIRGPRRFLLRHTVGRLQNEEAWFVRAEKNVKMLNSSVDLMKKESRKLVERATLAEKEMMSGQTDLMNAGKQIQHLAKSMGHVQTQAADLVDLLRKLPGREALQLRAEVASVASCLMQQRTGLEKRMIKLTEMGFPI